MTDKTWRIAKWSGVGIIAALVLAIPYFPGRLSPVTREGLVQAESLWEQASIADYDMELETAGAQTGRYHVEVRDHQLSNITRDGVVADPKEGNYWTVEGLFRVIEEELEAMEHPERSAYGAGSQVWLRVSYETPLGYPERFVRQVKQPARRSATGYEVPATTISVEIRVTRLVRR